jgi:hypothetical protein
MSCRKPGHDDDNCVCAVLRRIADAQDMVDPDPVGDCEVSCERSIEAVLAGATFPPVPGPNTIPVILYCDCSPFLGFGVKKVSGIFTCFQTFVFRVSSVDEYCCASLELLETVPPSGTSLSEPLEHPCEQFPASGFTRTGICITVDLNCFCGVTCLEPVIL